MQFQLITPERSFFSGEAEEVTVPGADGYFGVLDGHAPLISTLKPGLVTVTLAGGQQQKVAVLGGVAEVTPERMSVLAETAKALEELTREQAALDLEIAERAVKEAIHDDAREQAEDQRLLAEIVLAAY